MLHKDRDRRLATMDPFEWPLRSPVIRSQRSSLQCAIYFPFADGHFFCTGATIRFCIIYILYLFLWTCKRVSFLIQCDFFYSIFTHIMDQWSWFLCWNLLEIFVTDYVNVGVIGMSWSIKRRTILLVLNKVARKKPTKFRKYFQFALWWISLEIETIKSLHITIPI